MITEQRAQALLECVERARETLAERAYPACAAITAQYAQVVGDLAFILESPPSEIDEDLIDRVYDQESALFVDLVSCRLAAFNADLERRNQSWFVGAGVLALGAGALAWIMSRGKR